MSELSFLKDSFPNNTIEFFENYAYIVNLQSKRKIYVDDEFVFRFETQHIHFCEEKALIDCIKSYLNDEIVAIEFY